MNLSDSIRDLIANGWSTFSSYGQTFLDSISVPALVQIAILYFAIYAILKKARGSRFGQALLGVGVIATILEALSAVMNFDVITQIVKVLLYYLAISSVVIFQPEIRRFLMTVGAFGFFEKPKHHPDGSATIALVCEAIENLARRRTGALIAFEKGISLRSLEQSGVQLDARFSTELVQTIFTPPLPLHDGGMIIRNGRISSAHVTFPVSSSDALSSSGMRHRAAVGLSEETDALIVVVSEERGSVSIAHNGRLFRYNGCEIPMQLPRWIGKALPEDDDGNSFRAHVMQSLQKFFARLHPSEEEVV